MAEEGQREEFAWHGRRPMVDVVASFFICKNVTSNILDSKRKRDEFTGFDGFAAALEILDRDQTQYLVEEREVRKLAQQNDRLE